MKILVTGAAGFIGFHVSRSLLERGHNVVGIDNINDYYDVGLKFDRLNELGISRSRSEEIGAISSSDLYPHFRFSRIALEDKEALTQLFKSQSFDVVCNLAAQAGVRYSLENPEAYVESNIVGFLNILENCRQFNIQHLVYASSSSVYGQNTKVPFEVTDRVDHPISLYAATKKSNELMAHTYSHLFGITTTGLRFFTVYGPWGRPDMAIFLFTDAIVKKEPIEVFNRGDLERDFTYIDDITAGVIRVIETPIKRRELYKLYNIGNNISVKLLDFITALEEKLGIKAVKKMMPMQPGDVNRTWANIDDMKKDYEYKPETTLQEGIENFVTWYRNYYKI